MKSEKKNTHKTEKPKTRATCETYKLLRLHWLPAGTHWLHLRSEEWTLANLQNDSRIRNLLCNVILQMLQKTTGLQKVNALHCLETNQQQALPNSKTTITTSANGCMYNSPP